MILKNEFETILWALEKQMSKKPIETDWTHNCPSCNTILGSGIKSIKYNYCPNCG